MPSGTVLDFETMLTRPGLQVPAPACASTYHPQDGIRVWLTHELPALCERVLASELVIGHDFARFDAPVIAEWFPWLRAALWQAFEEGRVHDTLINQRLIQIQRNTPGPLSQSDTARALGLDVPSKDDDAIQRIRMSFGQFIGARSLPAEHEAYCRDDAWIPFELYRRQLGTGLVSQRDAAEFARQSFWLALVSARGFRTDVNHVRIFAARVEEHLALLNEHATRCGFLRPDGSENTKAVKLAIIRAYGEEAFERFFAADLARTESMSKKESFEPWMVLSKVREAEFCEWLQAEDSPWRNRIPLSDSGRSVCKDKIAKADSGDDDLMTLETWGQWRAAAAKDVDLLMRGAVEPIHTRFGLANTLRSTSGDPNWQNWAKGRKPKPGDPHWKHKVWGVRECVRPREGMALVTTDAKGLENCSVAQCIIWATGIRAFADKINAGAQIHSELGSHVLGISIEELERRRALKGVTLDEEALRVEAEDARDCGKPGNFSLTGGMSKWQTLQAAARRGYGISMSEERTKAVIAAFRHYASQDGRQAWIDHAEVDRNADGRYDFSLGPGTDVWLRNRSRTDRCNNPFQYLGMHVMTRAGWLLLRGQYLTGTCPGFCIGFTHDDFLSECHPDDVAEVAAFQEACIEQAGRERSPDVRYAGDSRALTHLSKAAKATKDADGRLSVTQVEM